MTLLSALKKKHAVVAMLMHKASHQGIDYLTGMMVAIGLSARNWGRVIADDSQIDFTKYIQPESAALCEDEFAHYLAEATLNVTTVEQASTLRAEMNAFYELNGVQVFARNCIHTISLYCELLDDVLDIKNGDYEAPEADDDRRP